MQLKEAHLEAALLDKLIEETKEAVDASGPEEFVAEVGDVMDVLDALLKIRNLSWMDVMKARSEKTAKFGDFSDGVFATYIQIVEEEPDAAS